MSGIDRRAFLKIVAASGAATAAGGCGQGAEWLRPHVSPPENIVPGIPAYFSTVCRECPAGCGAIAKNRDGRVIKLEGNPDHPVNAGALCIRGHSALQGLYHPDRLRGALVGGKPAKWEEAEKAVVDKLAALTGARQGGKIALVTGLETGSLARLMDEWGKALGARPRVAYEPLGYEPIRAANRIAFGREAIPDYLIGEAAYLLSFGADFLETWLSPVGYAGDFARMHAFAHGRAGTFVHVEPRLSVTAANADRWVRNAPGTEGLLALAMLKVILDAGLQAPGADTKTLGAAVQGVDVARAAAASGVEAATLGEIAHDLAASKGGLAIGGGVGVSAGNATETQVAINLLNAAVGALGTRIRFGNDSVLGLASSYADMVSLTQAMGRGEIEVLLLGDVNPVYTMPLKAGFAEALAKVPLVVSLANRPSETAARAHVALPALHWLESWGDYVAEEGVVGLMQPTMGPVEIEGKPVEAKSVGDLLLSLGRQVLGSEPGKGPLPWPTFQELVKAQWKGLAPPARRDKEFDAFWEESLRKGGAFRQTAAPPVVLRPEAGRIKAEPARLEGAGSHALLVYPSARFYDGRGADRAWLQEAPDSMTQITWDGWVEVPAETARRLGLSRGDVVTLTSPHGKIELPAYPSDSLHPGAVAVAMGQGHEWGGLYARERGLNAGANPMRLLAAAPEAQSGGLPHLAVTVELARTGARRPLAIPQSTHDQDDRELAQHVPLGAAREMELRGRPPEHASHPSMYPQVRYPEHRWGMAVDLDRCTGCQACVVACVAENNVPVVGREQVAYGRDQHWLRLERWEEGQAGHPENIFLPMFCQHCGVAPCEPVCPVYAAYHTQEGLNGQVYNRCVGTRYCGNNCPYHVRRFNWFYYTFPAPLDLQLNPEVTVRQLGVMEKCTMCVQRILQGKDAARDENRPVRDGEIRTACQETCPTQAITFGDLKDDRAAVSRLSRSPRGYHVLEELGTQPAVTYLKKVIRGRDLAPAKGHKA
ncbi:MAG: 4Fe-4S dicluster domain-containing protein [Candidatus Rokubacteria bacterium]|nr:4Fe-4S dicluster domain-containing protein [Candidatus Rokubacteria bacterium]